MAIVLPNGDFENSSLAYLRYYILSRAEVLAVVNLPSDTFVPFGTGVKASVLFLRKAPARRTTGHGGTVFFGKVSKLGYQSNKNGSTVYQKDKAGRALLDETGAPLVDEDISDLVRNYIDFLDTKQIQESDNCFAVPLAELSCRLDLEYYMPKYRLQEALLRKKGAQPLCEVVKILKRKAPILSEPEQDVLYVELSDINVEYCEISNATPMKVHELPSRASFELQEGDLITAVAGNSIGTGRHMSALVTKEYAGAVCSNGFRILQPTSVIDPYYLLYYLRKEYFLQQVFRYRTGAAIPAISDEDLGRVLVYVPSEQMQRAIARKVRESFELRQKSTSLMRSIELTVT